MYIVTIFIHHLSRRSNCNIGRSNKIKWLYSKKIQVPENIQKKIIKTDDADDLTLLVNTPAQTESLLHCQDQAAGDNYLIGNPI